METKEQIEKRTKIKFCKDCDTRNLVYCDSCATQLTNRLRRFHLEDNKNDE